MSGIVSLDLETCNCVQKKLIFSLGFRNPVDLDEDTDGDGDARRAMEDGIGLLA